MKFSPNDQRLLFKLLLSQRGQNPQKSEGGFVLVVALGMTLFLSLLVVTYAMMSKVDTVTNNGSAKSTTGFYAAEAGLNLRAKTLRDIFQGYNRPAGTSPSSWQMCRDNDSSNNGTVDFACNNANTFQGQPTSTYVSELPDNPTIITINPGELFAGLSAQEYRYDLFSAAFDNENLPTAILSMRFKSRLVSLFQFAAFYNKDLEILPGPNMTLNGPVHANGDLYLNSGATLTINGQVSTVGSLYRGRKDDLTCAGTVNVYDPTNPTSLNCNGGRTAITNVSAWNNQIRLGISRLQLPPVDFLDPQPGLAYWDKADLRIVLRLDNSGNPAAIEVRNPDNTVDTTRTTNLLNSCTTPNTTLSSNAPTRTSTTNNNRLSVVSSTGFAVGDSLTVGSDIDSNVISSISGNTITLRRKFAHDYQTTSILSGATVRKAIVSTSDTFYNYREAKYIRMLEIDVQGLMNCAHQQNLMDSGRTLNDATNGGLVWYFTVLGPNSTIDLTAPSPPADGNNYGVRIRNGSTLASTVAGAPAIRGLTIVTDQAFYTQGDYNSVNKKPASVLADTINVLSGNWLMDDSRSRNYDSNNLPSTAANLSSRPAIATTVNAAFLAGTDTTGGQEGTAGQGGSYNGGLENYPRFHEDWGGFTLTYRGSFVSLNQPRKVDGDWCGTGGSATSGCNIYNAPVRTWDYDTDFNNASNLPPLSPRFVYLQQEVFSRSFDR
jgi:hypothetical protein